MVVVVLYIFWGDRSSSEIRVSLGVLFFFDPLGRDQVVDLLFTEMGYSECLTPECNGSYDEVLEHLTPYGWVRPYLTA